MYAVKLGELLELSDKKFGESIPHSIDHISVQRQTIKLQKSVKIAHLKKICT